MGSALGAGALRGKGGGGTLTTTSGGRSLRKGGEWVGDTKRIGGWGQKEKNPGPGLSTENNQRTRDSTARSLDDDVL